MKNDVGDPITQVVGEFGVVDVEDIDKFEVFIFKSLVCTDKEGARAAGGVNDFYFAQFLNGPFCKSSYPVFLGFCIDLVEAYAEISFEKFYFFIGDFPNGIFCDEAGKFGRGIVYSAFFSFGGFCHFG